MPTLRVYVRSGCHLCDDMLQTLNELQQEYSFELEVIDILGNSRLEAEYGQLIPVLCGWGNGNWKEICHYFIDLVALKQYFGTT